LCAVWVCKVDIFQLKFAFEIFPGYWTAFFDSVVSIEDLKEPLGITSRLRSSDRKCDGVDGSELKHWLKSKMWNIIAPIVIC